MAVSSDQIEKALRTSLKEAERLRQQNQQLLAKRSEPIAIVGMSCRYPGGISSPDGLWELVAAGGNGVGDFPTDRGWEIDGLYDLTPEQIEAGFGYRGGFLEDGTDFDPAFFGIIPREALAMDPQQRLLLEGTWEALEDAGIDPTELRGSDTGVFAGICTNSYMLGAADSEEIADLMGYLTTGVATSVASGRVAYAFGLEGPALSIDTACSSSLVAIHLAAQALRNGECQLALAGGVAGVAGPHVFVEFQSQGGLAPDGQCKSFSAQADGAGFSEGLGLLVLERLSDAKRNGREILAVIKGSATNQDGASNGLTAPNGPSQERVIRQALASAGLEPADVDAVEAHGTGTVLGDPIEAKALLSTYGQDRETPLQLGSLKSNLGHTQAAAGVGGVIKMVMALREEALPRTLHVEEPTPHVDWQAGEIELLTETRAWPKGEKPRRAGVSSFGVSGTNAHLIVEEAPAPAAAEPRPAEPTLLPWALSAKSPEALAAAARRLADHVRARDLDPADVAHTLLEARAQLEHRAVVVGADREELLAGLDALAENRPAPNLVSGRAVSRAKMAFVFPGHGSQWLGMARELLDESPLFAASIERCEQALAPYMEQTVTELLRSEEAAWLLQVPVQPAMFAVMVSLVDLWRAHGVEPDAFVGHSQGEVSAAVACGAISLEEGARLACLRAELLSQLIGTGSLVAANLSARDADKLIERFDGGVSVAAINGPSAVLLACSTPHLEDLIELLESSDVRHKPLASPIATHSHHVEVLQDQVMETFADLTPREVPGSFYSTVAAEPIATAGLDADYWYRNMRQPVRLHETFQALLNDGYSAFIEASGHPVLSMSLREAAEAESKGSVAILHTLRRGEGGMRRLLTSLADAYVQGVAVDFSPLLEGSGAAPTKLPTYPFQRQRYWFEQTAGAGNVPSLGQRAAEHPLLGAAISIAGEETHLFTGRVSLQTHPWLADHGLAETAVLPGTAFVELALRAGREVGAEQLRELILEAPLVIPNDGALQVQVSLAAEEEGAYRLLIHARPEPKDAELTDEAEPLGWTQHASGTLTREPAPSLEFDATAWPPPAADPIAVEDFYDRLAAAGFAYGPAFQGVEAAWRQGDYCYADVSLAPEQEREAGRFGVHPALLDAALHTAFVSVDSSDGRGGMLPFAFNGVRLHQPQGPAALRVRVAVESERIRLEAADPEGSPVISIGSVLARPVDPALFSGSGASEDALLVPRWRDLELPAAPEGESGVEVFACESDPDPDRDPIDAAHELCAEVLERLQAFLAAGLGEARLAFVTRGAQAVLDGESPDVAAAAVHGLVRSAQVEHPGRFLLLDSDGSEASRAALAAALQVGDEPLLALRDGEAKVPRLTKQAASESGRVSDGDGADPAPPSEGTVLITGGLSGVGALTARHLAANHGIRNLLLLSRRGAASPGAAELIAELAELGCEAEAVACDVSDRAQLAELIGSIPAERPLIGVYHSAAILADGVIENLDRERLDAVLAAKADSAWHLHELTRDRELSDFVLYSSAAGSFGSPGQGNYAAANTFLDALATRRRAEGLAGTSVAWGLWAQASGLDETADRERLSGFGLVPIEDAKGAELLDRARQGADPFAVAAPMQAATMRAAASAGLLPPLLSELFKVNRRRARAAAGFLARRLAAVPQAERQEIVLAVVREHTASVLGHSSPKAIDPSVNFKDLGFDSLGAVELRNRLAQATGVQLDVTLVFDRPTPEAIAAYLLEQVEGKVGGEVVVRPHRGSDEPIAIVGMACRFPGEVATPQQLWQMLAAGEDGTGPLPANRDWDVESLYAAEPNGGGDAQVKRGGFLADVTEFDPAFFGISPREALAMDPQQRLLLECSWEAFEDAGIDVASLRGSSTGAFVGMSTASYGFDSDAWRSPELEGHMISGLAPSIASGRIAYILGLEGPALTIDTACSASLVAMHLAAQALQSGECDLALAGGVTVVGHPAVLVSMGRQGVLAADGRCKAFSAAADGMGAAEGSGMVLLERLSDAKRNGREILAVIKGSATNQDGASNGLTAPSGPSQERVIRQALANAGLKASEVDAVEAHGTGTILGDPIEAQALLATYGQDRETPLAVGSVKSNIGHTQTAAGVAGVMKMVLALREEALPRTLHASEPTPHVDWSTGEVELLSEQRPWPRGEKPRRAGISSFGISGTNAHLIIEEAPEQPQAEKDEARRPPLLPFALSAKAPEALAEMAGRLAAHLEEGEPDPLDVAHTLLNARAQLEHRAVIVAADQAELLQGLDALVRGKGHESLSQAKVRPGALAFLLSGQGSQRPRMGEGLHASFPAYAEAFDQACDALAAEGIEVREALRAEPGSELSQALQRTDLTQASLFALQVGLYALTSSFGLRPDYLLGHSVGEITAAHLAGVFDLAEAAKLLAARGRLMAALPEGGAMALVRASEAEVEASLAEYEGRLTIAAVNSPTQITVSGDQEALAQWQAEQEAEGREARALQVSHAFHSHRMEPMLGEFEAQLTGLEAKEPQIPVISNRTGEPLTQEQAQDPSYWASQVRESVRFADGLAYLEEQGTAAYLELGPAAVLSALLAESDAEKPSASTLRHQRDDLRSFLTALGTLHAAGQSPDFSQLLAGTGAAATELPTYPFQRQRYWLEASKGTGDASSLGQSTTEHPLLAASIPLAGEGTVLLTGRISHKAQPWLADHTVAGTAILPAAAFVELCLRAGEEVGATHLEELVLEGPLPIPAEGAVQLQLAVTSNAGGESHAIEIHARPERDADEEERPFTRHASATLTAAEPKPLGFDATVWPPSDAEPIASEDFYERVAETGLEYGPAFQGLEAAWRVGEEVYAEVSLAPEQEREAGRYAVHPALLDAALQVSLLAEDAEAGLRLPSSFARVSVPAGEAGASPSALRVRLAESDGKLSIEAADTDGFPVVAVEAFELTAVDPERIQADPDREDLYTVEWPEIALPAATESAEPATEVFRLLADASLDPVAATHALAAEVLARLQAEVAKQSPNGKPARLAFLSEAAVALDPSESHDPAAAAAWGLVRAAQSEHPGRFTLIDSDGSEASEQALAQALAVAEEPQLALREGVARVPRLARAGEGEPGQGAAIDPEGTVLISGDLAGLGARLARDLAATGRSRHLLLSGNEEEAAAAEQLVAELTELGSEATIVACDLSDRAAVESLLASVPAQHPLAAIVHCAAAPDDAAVAALDGERLAAALTARADAAWCLHEAGRGADLASFVLVSSASAALGAPGQASLGAAGAFLEALAARRRAEGLPGTAIAWGAAESGSTAAPSIAALDRAVAGVAPLLAMSLQPRALRAAARAGLLPPLLSNLVRLPARRPVRPDQGTLARRLAGVPAEERQDVVLALVREEAASVLGHSDASSVDAERNLLELGFDSLGAVELRNRLAAATGIEIAPTVALEHPTPTALAAYLLARFQEGGGGGGSAGTGVGPKLTLRRLVDNAHAEGRMAEIATVLSQMSRFQPSFASAAELDQAPEKVEIARDGQLPRLICLPSFIVGSGPHQFARIARALNGRRPLTSLALPGFRPGERLPSSWEAAVDVLAAVAVEAAAGEPFVLTGFSSGGPLAYALAERLEAEGTAPEGLVLLDSYLITQAASDEAFAVMLTQMLDRNHEAIAIDDDHLLAMAAYIRLFREWDKGELEAPTLMVRAVGNAAEPASPAWPESATVGLANDHFSMIGDDASLTADAIDSWLAARPADLSVATEAV
jgi:acyl transferase domain-containing protein/acyl carrier protein